MRCEGNSESYLSLSRKELQELCKINHLPANRSKDELAKSLSLFFEKISATSTAGKEKPSTKKGADPSENLKGTCEGTVLLESGNRPPCCMKEKERDMDLQSSKSAPNTSKNAVCPDYLPQKLCDSTFKAGSEGRQPSVVANVHQKQRSSGWHVSGTNNEIKKYSELRNNGNRVSIHADSDIDLYNSVLPNKLPSMTTKGGFIVSEEICRKEAPSFQFFVMSEEGLNLHVDLNLSPAEWVNSLKEEVGDSLKMSDPKYTILNSTGTEKNCDCNASILSSDSENCQPDATFGSSDSSVLTSSIIPVKMAGCLDGNQLTSSSATLFTIQKHSEDVCLGNDTAFAENSIDASSGVEKNSASVRDTSLRLILDVSENDGLVNSLTNITEESSVLQSYETEKNTAACQYSIGRGPVGNTENDNADCQVSIEKEPAVGSFGIAGHFNGLAEPQTLDCLANEAQSDGVSAVSILNSHAHGFENYFAEGLVSVLKVEVDGNSSVKDREISELSRSQNSSENNSKRPQRTGFHEEFSSKRQNSSEKNKSGMMVNLRSTRTSAKETVFEQAACPRRSSRLREVRPR